MSQDQYKDSCQHCRNWKGSSSSYLGFCEVNQQDTEFSFWCSAFGSKAGSYGYEKKTTVAPITTSGDDDDYLSYKGFVPPQKGKKP